MGDYSVADWFQMYEKDVTSFLIYYTGSKEVEDLVQDTFLVAINKLSSFKGKSHPKTWLISIARNIVIDRYRRRKVWERIKHVLSSEEAYSNDLEANIISKLNNSQLNKAIHKLTLPYKEVVILRGILDLSSMEASTILKCSQNKVNVRYHRALKKLRKLLEEDGFFYDR